MSWYLYLYVAVVPRVCDIFLPSSVPTGTGTQVPLQLVPGYKIYVLVRGRSAAGVWHFTFLPSRVPTGTGTQVREVPL